MFDSFVESLLLVIFLPIASYKIWRFSRKFWQLATEPVVSIIRERLEKAWRQS